MPSKNTIDSALKRPEPTIKIYIRTILLVISWLILGICGEINGPTLAILAHNIHVTYTGIASALAARSAGGLLTNIICGIFQKLVQNYPDSMLTIAFFVFAILVSLTPYISSLTVMCVAFFIQGVTGSFINMGGTNLLFKMWTSRVAAPFSMVHLGYGCGAIIANLLVRPFLSHETSYVNDTASRQFNSTLSTSISVSLNSDIRIPYLIAASLCFLISIGHLIFFIQEQSSRRKDAERREADYTPVNTMATKTDSSIDQIKYSQYSPAICGHGYFGYGLLLSIVFIVYMFFVAGTDQTFAKFYFSYLKFEKFNISNDRAGWGVILFWLSFSIGRLIGAVVCVFVSLYICLVVTWSGGLLLAVMWIVYVWIIGLTATSLFILGSLTGLIIGPLFPLSFAWINEKLNVIPTLLAAILCGCGLGSIILQKIAGFVMDRDPNHFATLLIICVIVTIILYVMANVIIFFHQRNLKTLQHPTINDASRTSTKLDEEEQQMANYLQGVNET